MVPSYSGTHVIDVQEIAEAMADFVTRAHRLLDGRMRLEGLSLARFKPLGFIAREQPVRSADLASALGYSPRTVTEALDGLERDGLIERQPDPTDRRAKRIRATPAGEAALRASDPLRTRFREDVFGVLNAEERSALSAALAKMNQRLEMLEAPRKGQEP